MSEDQDRHSKALDAELISDPAARAEREAKNGLRQIDEVLGMIEHFSHPERNFKLRPSHLLHLHRIALDGISSYAGNWRPAGIEIGGSKHQPIGAYLVPGEIEEMCDYVNDNWSNSTAIHLAAYALWRLNWIHPFTDGNGRTARAFSYLLLCLRLGYRLPGRKTIPEQIAADKLPTTGHWKRRTKYGLKRKLTCLLWKTCWVTCWRSSWLRSTRKLRGRSSNGRSAPGFAVFES